VTYSAPALRLRCPAPERLAYQRLGLAVFTWPAENANPAEINSATTSDLAARIGARRVDRPALEQLVVAMKNHEVSYGRDLHSFPAA